MSSDPVTIWTIGHSNQSFEEFYELLHQHEIKLVCDIRRLPGSRKFPHFNSEELSQRLSEHGLEYHWLQDLGGRRTKGANQSTENEGWRNKSFRNYANYMQTSAFRDAYKELRQLAGTKRTAIMCSESVFWRCHRRLVSDYAVASGEQVEHIFPNGDAKPHALTSEARVKSTKPVTVIYPADSEAG